MGLRIQKRLGYGLIDVETDKKGNITDNRFNFEFLQKNNEEPEKIFEEFRDWIINPLSKNEIQTILGQIDNEEEERKKYLGDPFLVNYLKENNNPFDINNPFFHEREFGLKNVVIFQPIYQKNWHRWDDDIDYYEAGGNTESNINTLDGNCGIYPWLGMVRKPNAPEPNFPIEHLDQYDRNIVLSKTIAPAIYNQQVGKWDKNQPPVASGEMLDYLLKWYRPRIPQSIILYSYFAKIFKDLLTIQELKPMIYTYWA